VLDTGDDRTAMQIHGGDEDIVTFLGEKYGCGIEGSGTRCVFLHLTSDRSHHETHEIN